VRNGSCDSERVGGGQGRNIHFRPDRYGKGYLEPIVTVDEREIPEENTARVFDGGGQLTDIRVSITDNCSLMESVG